MLANRGVETRVGDLEAPHGLIAEDMRLNNFLGIGESHVAVPDGFGIDDDGRSMLALVEAPGLVGSYRCLDARD